MVIKNGNVFLDGNIKKCDISFEEKITAIGDTAVSDTAGWDNVEENSAERKNSVSSCLEQEILDAEGLYVFPGFIDIHTHGGGGGDFMDATETAFEHALKFHAENGTTSVVATSVTADPTDIKRMLEITRAYKNGTFASGGARVIGAHVEGPYLSKKNKGAQHERYLRVPSKDSYEFLLNAADVIKTVTLSPELDGANKICGALDLFPKHCITLGMRQLLKAKCLKVYLYCGWQWGIMRKMALEDENKSMPVSFLQSHPNSEMVVTKKLYDFSLSEDEIS